MSRNVVQLTATNARQKLQNASITSTGGAMGIGDRSVGSHLPYFSDNPYTSNDYVYRWRQYVMMYETAWEARKIVRIPVEDALRKGWVAEGIDARIAKDVQAKLNKMQIIPVLSRSLMLERLLGGCLTFMGLDSDTDDTGKEYVVKSGSQLRFLNAVPLSRISRMTWCTDPLSEHYMRPDKYLINGEDVHASRCLVWDGEPLFDPYDFALTNFRSNLAGFGPSKLATVWDDVVKAIGTRQAAYQLIQTNNAIIAAISGLQDLAGTKPGKAQMEQLKSIMNQLSLYRAALIDGEKVDIKQHSASFGSVPELIITYLQVLSAASDIPATRFIGQAPGGLNATGESDLENYYNMIDAYQTQRIEPQLRRLYDIIGYSLAPKEWPQQRNKLEFKFPPLWNLSELEEADRSSKIIDNAMKLRDAGLCSDEKIIQELNVKKALSVTLDETDISVVAETGLGDVPADEEIDTQAALAGLRQNSTSVAFRNADPESLLIAQAGGDPDKVDRAQFQAGMKVEMEHWNVTGGDPVVTAKIVLAHLDEVADYYTRLERVENAAVVHYQKGADKYAAACNTPMDIRGEQTTSTNPADVTCTKCRKKLSGKFGFPVTNSAAYPAPGQHTATEVHGLHIAIENPKGSIRSSKDPADPWTAILPADYGFVKKTEGADGDEVDVFIGEHPESELVFVIDQKDLATGAFDEHKCILGCLAAYQAKDLYAQAYSDGKGEERILAMTPLHIDDFKRWVRYGDTKQPFAGEIQR